MKKSYILTLSRWNSIIKDHLVYGQALLPGLAYIDILYRLAQGNLGLDYRKHYLRRVSIFKPLFVKEDKQVEIRVSFEKIANCWYVKVEEIANDNQGDPLQDKLYITAELHEETVEFNEQIDIKAMKKSVTQTVDIENVYAAARNRGLIHRGMIKAKGNIYLTDTGCLIEVNVDEAYRDEARGFLFHPALIDGAAMASWALEVKGEFGNDKDLYLPLYYESFFCIEPLHFHCYAIASISLFRKINDICSMDIAFFNEEGNQVAQLKGITGKLIRNKEQMAPNYKKDNNPSPSIQETFDVIESFSQLEDKNTKFKPEYMKRIVRQIFSKHLHREPSQIDLDLGYFELGLESAQLLSIVKDIESAFSLSLNPTLLFESSNIRELLDYLAIKEKETGDFQYPKTDEEWNSNSVNQDGNTYEFYEHEAYLQDHLIYGRPALMGLTHPCLVLQTYLQNNPQTYPVELKNIQFEGGPVTLAKEENVFVQVQFNNDKNQTGFRTVHYTAPNNTKLCCQGAHIGNADAFPEILDIKEMLNQSKPLERKIIDEWYHFFKHFTIGPMLQIIESAYRHDESTVIGRVCLSDKLKKENVSQFIFDPLMLNACYMLRPIVDIEDSEDTFVPLMIENLTVYRTMTETAYIVKTFRSQKSDFSSFDAMVLTETGEIIAEVINASVKKVTDLSQLTNASFGAVASKPVFIKNKDKEDKPEENEIAIVGLSGRYPGSYDANAFWENLRDGIDCITEIPKERWAWQDYYTKDRTRPGYIYSKWGGFIDDVDRFDPVFFNISPRTAAEIDPQERLFLEQCWMALEDAGYIKAKLQETVEPNLPNQVGVYVGVMHQEYSLYAAESGIRGKRYGLSTGMASIANRVSYCFDFHGPSMAIDTMCSSSLTAIYLACQALKEKNINVALAGGVNITIHPNKYLLLSQGQFISSKGHCESFGEGGDGYIPGEGVGVLVLKRLTDAKRDRDNIYGVIKGVAINHGGRTGGYTVPNQKAQSLIISQALRDAGIKPRAISYIEAHGTGTVLGDPIEIAALTQAFEQDTEDRQFCAIGSVKSNIGHCEGAAGIAGVTKILLQLKYGQLVPSLHSKTTNRHINFSDTPFVVQQELAEWKRPLVSISGEIREYPRIAGISSFGAGGANVHIIIEEYIPEDQEFHPMMITPQNPAIIVLSAKNEDRLQAQVRQLLIAIEERHLGDAHLADMAYTLQVGREAMDERLAVVAGSIKELEKKLNSFTKGRDGIENLYTGRVGGNKDALGILAVEEELQEVIDKEAQQKKYKKLLESWVKGLPFDWDKLYGQSKPRRISLPSYPFARKRYWVDQHASDIPEQQLSSTFSRQEPVPTDQALEKQHSEAALENSFLPGSLKEPFLSNIATKPSGISLRSLSGDQVRSNKPVGQIPLISALPAIGSLTPPGKKDQSEAAAIPRADISPESLEEELRISLAEILYIERNDTDVDESFIDLGLDSVTGVEWTRMINKQYGTSIPATRVYDYPNIREFAGFLAKELNKQRRESVPTSFKLRHQEKTEREHEERQQQAGLASLRDRNGLVLSNVHSFIEATTIETTTNKQKGRDAEGIAIIGISGQFPKSKTLTAFWDNLARGADCISEIPATRWSIDEYYDPDPQATGKTYCKWMGVLEDADQFDPLFFNISPAEAELMDPQQRLFLENCWHCIEDAALSPSSLSGSRCGVFVGCATNDYGQNVGSQGLSAQGLMGGATSILTARISYLLNLKGPCLAIDTACSSSLVAIAEACNSLILHTSDLALAGGVCAMAGPSMHIMASKAGMLSADGRCFTFDNRANGFVPGEGVGVVLLKRVSDAVRDQDLIYGVIRGWGVNQDGKTNGITAPSVNSQIVLEKEVYQRFNINPETISMVETHGTGTKLGDPIEVEALVESFRSCTDKKNYCALGSVKSNIGHLLTAGGISGVIKVLLALQHRMLPPTIHFETLNEHIFLDDSPFYINTELRPWEAAPGIPRRAAVSSFGFSGTNAHLVIEEYFPEIGMPIPIDTSDPVLFVLSAKSEEQLKTYAECMKNHIASHEEIDLANVAYTLQVGREAMEHRLAFLASSKDALLRALEGFINNNPPAGVLTAQVKKSKDGVAVFEADEDLQKAIKAWIDKGKYAKLLDLWVKGLSLDWNHLYPDTKPQRISLPTYPFARERYWIPETTTTTTSFVTATMEIKQEFAINPNNTTQENIQEYLIRFLSQELNMPQDQIGLNENIQKYGVDSIIYMKLMRDFEKRFQTKITGREMLEYRMINSLSAYLALKIDELNNQEIALNAKLEIKSQQRSEHMDDLVIEMLDKFKQGVLTLEEIEKLIDSGGEVI